MKFYYNGRKKSSTGNDIAIGCLLFVAFGAIIMFFSLIDDIEDLEEYWLELIFIFLMAGGTIFSIFRKKGKLYTHRIEITDSFLKMNDIQAKLEDIQLDIYFKEDSFERYHLWDKEGKISLFSVYEDDLSKHFKDSYSSQVNKYSVNRTFTDGPHIKVNTPDRTLSYNLDVGNYSISNAEGIVVNHISKAYAYDGRYKKGIGLIKKK